MFLDLKEEDAKIDELLVEANKSFMALVDTEGNSQPGVTLEVLQNATKVFTVMAEKFGETNKELAEIIEGFKKVAANMAQTRQDLVDAGLKEFIDDECDDLVKLSLGW
jgi:hypothetical protein